MTSLMHPVSTRLDRARSHEPMGVLGRAVLVSLTLAICARDVPSHAQAAQPSEVGTSTRAAVTSAEVTHPTDRDFAALEVPPSEDLGVVCTIIRDLTLRAPFARVELAYARAGKLVAFESWRVPVGGGSPTRVGLTRLRWRGERVASIHDETGGGVVYAYGPQGLLKRAEDPNEGGTGTYSHTEYAWDVRPIADPARRTAPRELGPSGLPWHLPFAGSVRVTRVEGKVRPRRFVWTHTYDAQGSISSSEHTWRWDGDALREHAWSVPLAPGSPGQLRGRAIYEYDAAGRVTRRRSYAAREGSRAFEPDNERRYEHRCEGDFSVLPLWPEPARRRR